MEMLWTDLEVGDKVKFTDEVLEFYKSFAPNWVSQRKDKIFTIARVVVYNDKINIYFHKNNVYAEEILLNGENLPLCMYQGCLFEIVELKED